MRSGKMSVIHDDYGNQIVHISHCKSVYHVSLAGDQNSAVCLETGDRVEGHSRQDCLRQMAAKIGQLANGTCLGVCG